MEHKLTQNQSQKLVLSPQMRQYLRLLQIPAMELEQAIQQELTENPVLEETQPKDPPSDQPSDTETERDRPAEELRFGESYGHLEDSPDDSTPSNRDYSRQNPADLQKAKDFMEQSLTDTEDLYHFLNSQIQLLDLSASEKKIAEQIIGNMDEHGYLRISLDEIAASTHTPLILVENVLKKIQSLDPPGVCARSLDEALLIQIRRRNPVNRTAESIILQSMDLFKKRDWPQISKKLDIPVEEVKSAGEEIMKLEPYPGRSFYSKAPIAITPDAVLRVEQPGKDDPVIRIEILNDHIPELRINSYYRRLLRDPKTDAETKKFLKEKIQKAADFITALDQRKTTIRKVTEEIADYQKEFLLKGFAHLKPMRLKDIAETVKLHESTISRALQGKYVSTPQGTIPFKSFFSSKMETTSGEDESQKSIMEKIKGLVEKENTAKPMSDEEIVKRLQEEGVKIARRTVAKYRDMLRILPSHLRKRK